MEHATVPVAILLATLSFCILYKICQALSQQPGDSRFLLLLVFLTALLIGVPSLVMRWCVGAPIGIALAGLFWLTVHRAKRGKPLYIRRIPGLSAIDEAVGRATEMGRPMMFCPGLDPLGLPTLQALSILKYITSIAAKYRSRIIVPTADSVVFTIAEEISKEAYSAEGVPEQFNPEDIRFLSNDQFAYASGCVGILNRERVASNFLFGYFYAESLILAETGHQVGAMQVAGTPAITQIPFFITAADYTIIGDEFYAASAYLSREPTLLGSLVGQDYAKAILVFIILAGVVTATIAGFNLHASWLNWVHWFKPA
ncbi:MAG: hypothetical protein NTU88_02840 [Armatimonadetes bacterium]|nr:hypothetical protein [Armatimonadota bacterium]